MDEAKSLAEVDVATTTAEFMRVFTDKYIRSTVTSRIEDHITHLVTSTGDAEPAKDEHQDEDPQADDPKEDVKAEAEADESREEKDSNITDDIEEEKEEHKAPPAVSAPSEYKASLSTGVYGSYAIKDVPIVHKLEFPLMQVTVDSFEKYLMDGNAHQYNAFNLLYWKLSLAKDDPSFFGSKLCRYSRIRGYHEAMAKTLAVKKLKFPPKNFAFWRQNDDDFLAERQAELDAYFGSSVMNSDIASSDIFGIFLGLKPDTTCSDRLDIFKDALRSTCNELQYLSPSHGALNLTRFDAEQEILLLSLMMDKRLKTDKSITNQISKVVSNEWSAMEKTTKSVNEELHDILTNKMGMFDEAVKELIAKVEPVLVDKLGASKEEKKGDDDAAAGNEEKEERDAVAPIMKPFENVIRRVVSVQNAAADAMDEKSMEYRASLSTGVYGFYALKQDPVRRIYEECCAALPVLNEEVVTRYLMQTVDACYGNDVGRILNAVDGYNKEMELICAAMAQLIRMCAELTLRYLLLVIDSDGEEAVMRVLNAMAMDIAKKVAETDKRLSNELQNANANASRLVLEGVSIVCGLIGDFIANVVNDNRQTTKKVDLEDNLTKNLNESVVVFCESVLDRLSGCVESVLVNSIKKETKESIDGVYGADKKVEFVFIVDEAAAPQTMALAIMDNVVEATTVDLVKKTIRSKQKRNALNTKFYKMTKTKLYI
eukprot:464616_1